MIPGSNLLKTAFRVIGKQKVSWLKCNGRLLNAVGVYESTYDSPIFAYGSFQPVPKNAYEQYGFDLTKTYVFFYTTNDVKIFNRGTSGDHVVFNGETYQCESDTDWHVVDGWKQVTLILLDNDA